MSEKLDVIVESSRNSDWGPHLGGEPSGSIGGAIVRNFDFDKIRTSLSEITNKVSAMIENIKVEGYELNELKVQVEVTSEGGFALVGSLKAGVTGGLTLTFKRNHSG